MDYFISYYYSYPGGLLDGGSAGTIFQSYGITQGNANASITRTEPISSFSDIEGIQIMIRESLQKKMAKLLPSTSLMMMSVEVISWRKFE